MNIKLERSIIKPKRNYRGNIVQPTWFTKYGRYLKEHHWSNIIVYRPYKVKVTEYNAERLFSRLVRKNDLGIKYLWYALEKDRDTNWTCRQTHPHTATLNTYIMLLVKFRTLRFQNCLFEVIS